MRVVLLAVVFGAGCVHGSVTSVQVGPTFGDGRGMAVSLEYSPFMGGQPQEPREPGPSEGTYQTSAAAVSVSAGAVRLQGGASAMTLGVGFDFVPALWLRSDSDRLLDTVGYVGFGMHVSAAVGADDIPTGGFGARALGVYTPWGRGNHRYGVGISLSCRGELSSSDDPKAICGPSLMLARVHTVGTLRKRFKRNTPERPLDMAAPPPKRHF